MAKFLNAEGLAHLVALIKQALPSKTSELTNDSGYVTGSKMYIGTCSTEAATNPKVCTVETFPLNDEEPLDGTIIGVKYSASDTSTSTTPTINVNGTGAKRIYYNNALLSTAKSTLQHGYANRYIYYFYDSSLDNGNGAWVWLGAGIDNNTTYSNVSLGQGYATCTTAAETVAKVASLSSYSLTANGIVSVKFSNDVPANATLNINSKGAKAIYHRDAPITAGIIKAGDTATFIYNTYYRLISIDRDDSADLSNYYNKTEVDTALDGKLDHIELYPLYEYLDGQGAVSEATAVVWNAEMQTLWNKATTQSSKMRTFQGLPAFPEDTGDNTYAWDIYGIFGAAVYIVAKVGYLIDNNGITKYYIAGQELKVLQHQLTFDSTPTSNSNNPVRSSGIKTALDGKQDLLVSGTNIKTINNNSLVGSGNVTIDSDSITMTDADPNDGIWGSGDTIQEAMEGITDGILTVYNETKPKDFVVTISKNNSTYTANKTYAEILAAYDGGKNVIAKYGTDVLNVSEKYSNSIRFSTSSAEEGLLRCFEVKSNNTWELYQFESQDHLTFDSTPTANSYNPVTSGGIKMALSGKQDKDLIVNITYDGNTGEYSADKTYAELVAAYNAEKNIKIVYDGYNFVLQWYESGESFYFTVTEGQDYNVQTLILDNDETWTLSQDNYQEPLTFDSTPTASSLNPVTSGGIKTAIDNAIENVIAEVDNTFIVVMSYTGVEHTLSADKTLGEIVNAFEDNKAVFAVIDGGWDDDCPVLPLRYILDNDSIIFSSISPDGFVIELSSNDTFDNGNIFSITTRNFITYDNAPTANSNNPVKSSGIKAALDTKQDLLVSGTNIKTIQGNSLLGSGDVSLVADDIMTASGLSIEEALYEHNQALNGKQDALVSGTNIKTVNNNTLLGRGNVTLDGSNIIYTGGEDYNMLSGDTLNECLDTLDEITYFKQDRLVSGTNIKTIQGNSLLGSGDVGLVADDIMTTSNLSIEKVLSEHNQALNGKQDALASGTNIKTVNNNSLLGSGDLHFDGGNLVYSGNETYELVAGETIDQNLDRIDVLIHDLGSPNEIASITTSESSASGGNNTVTITETNGTTTSFNVKNGIDGQDGQDGADGVSLGEIALVQTTGDSEESVMSQKSVTEYGRKVTAEDLAGTSDWVKAKLTEEGWVFGKYVVSSGNLSTNTSYVASPFFAVSGIEGHSITFAGGFAWSSACIAFYNESKTRVDYWGHTTNPRTITLATYATEMKYVRFTCAIGKIAECYILDNTTREYIFKGDEYLALYNNNNNITYDFLENNVIAQELGDNTTKVVSQKVLTDALNVAELTYNAPTHIGNILSYINFETDFPQFNPSTCEGISIVFDGDTKNVASNSNAPFMYISDGGTLSSNNPFFGFFFGYGTIYAGLIQAISGSSSSRIYNGCGTSIALNNYAHCALTFNFSTGEFCIYKNGILLNSAIPENYDEETVRSVLNNSKYMSLRTPTNTTYNQYTTTGFGVFGHILSASEVSTIFGAGCETTKGILLPTGFNAYIMYPQITSSWSIGGYNYSTYYTITNDTENGGKILATKENQTRMRFYIKPSSGNFSTRCRREFDFTIQSGSLTYLNTQQNGNEYNILVIKNSNGEIVTGELTEGTYHASCIPPFVRNPKTDEQLQIEHKFNTALNTVVWIHPEYKVTDLGCSVYASCSNYRGTYWEQYDGSKIPVNSSCLKYYDVYKPATVIYNSNNKPQFNGQMAVDTTNGKVYVGYLTGSGGTWKQINNS